MPLVADAHHQQITADKRIGSVAIYSTSDGQLPDQLSIDDVLTESDTDGETGA